MSRAMSWAMSWAMSRATSWAINTGTWRMRKLAVLLPLALLPGCISFGAEPPPALLTLTSEVSVGTNGAYEGNLSAALAVQVPHAPQKLNVTRVPVTTSGSSIAYLVDAVWVEKPANLFRNVLAETIRARGNRLVVDGGGLDYAATTQLMGELAEMGYDAPSGSVVVRYDALLTMPGGAVRTRRFEARIAGVPVEANAVGAALNRAANRVAAEVAEWVGES